MKQFVKRNLQRAATVIDDYGQMQKEQFETVKELPIAVFLKADIPFTNNPLYSEITHVGVYKGTFKDFQKHDRLDNTYIIDQVVLGNRKALLYLKETI